MVIGAGDRTASAALVAYSTPAFIRPRLLFDPGFAQTVEEVVDSYLVPIQLHGRPGGREFRVAFFQIGERCQRVLYPPELGEPGNDVGQAGDVTIVEGPGAPPDLDRLRIMPELVVGGRQAGQPDNRRGSLGLRRMPFSALATPSSGQPWKLSTAPSTACAAAKLGLSLIASLNSTAARSFRPNHIEISASAKWAFG